MIVKADDTLNEQILDYLDEEKAMNLFIIGDIENFGYDTDFQDIWVDLGEQGRYGDFASVLWKLSSIRKRGD